MVARIAEVRNKCVDWDEGGFKLQAPGSHLRLRVFIGSVPWLTLRRSLPSFSCGSQLMHHAAGRGTVREGSWGRQIRGGRAIGLARGNEPRYGGIGCRSCPCAPCRRSSSPPCAAGPLSRRPCCLPDVPRTSLKTFAGRRLRRFPFHPRPQPRQPFRIALGGAG